MTTDIKVWDDEVLRDAELCRQARTDTVRNILGAVMELTLKDEPETLDRRTELIYLMLANMETQVAVAQACRLCGVTGRRREEVMATVLTAKALNEGFETKMGPNEIYEELFIHTRRARDDRP